MSRPRTSPMIGRASRYLRFSLLISLGFLLSMMALRAIRFKPTIFGSSTKVQVSRKVRRRPSSKRSRTKARELCPKQQCSTEQCQSFGKIAERPTAASLLLGS
jgi:hypothetical protein